MLKRLPIVLVGLPLLAGATAAAALQPFQIHLGIADLDAILEGSKSVQLIEPKIEFEPAYERGVTSYSVPVPDGAQGITFVLESESLGVHYGIIDLNGVAGNFRGVTYSGEFGLRGKVIPLSLQPGENHVRVGFRYAGASAHIYEFAIVRQAEPTADADRLELTEQDRRAVQRLLNEKGFDAGPVDGQLGAKSRGALKAFQAQKGLPQSGVPDTATRAALGVDTTASTATTNARASRTAQTRSDAFGLRSLKLTDEGGNTLVLDPPFERDTTAYRAETAKDTNVMALETSAAKGTRLGVGQRSSSGGMTFSEYAEITDSGEVAGAVANYRHEFTDLLSRRQFTITVKITAEDGPESRTYSIEVTRPQPGKTCRNGQELKPGQSCNVPGGGVFAVLADGCVGDIPELHGELSMSGVSMSAQGMCIRGHVEKAGFRASANADASLWRIESLP